MVPLKRHLLFLVLGALLPLLVLAAGLTVLLIKEERDRTEQGLQEKARLLSLALDAELSRSITALQTLARNEALRRGDLRRFYEEAKDARDSLGLWDNVLLLSPKGEHVFNLLRPFGTPLPPVPQPEGPVTAARTGQAYVSNALRGRVDTEWLMFMNHPVAVDGEVKYVLGVTMNYRYWSRWLTERAPQGFIASIVDRNHVILARTHDAGRLAGQPVQPWFRDLLASRESGTVRGAGVLDPDVVVAYHRSELSGWHINLLTSGTVLDAPGRRSALVLVIGVALALAIAAALALARARVLTRGIRGLQEALEGLRSERPHVPALTSRVSEVDAAIAAARDTAAALAGRRQEIEALQADLRAQAEAQRLLVSLHDATRGLRDPEEVMDRVVALIARHYRVTRCTYGEVDAAGEHVTVTRDYVEGVPSVAGRHRLADFGPQIIAELKAGRTLALPDLQADARTNSPQASAAFHAVQARALLCVPLVKEGRLVALFALNHREPRAWSNEEVALLEQVAERTWLAVENARIEADLRESRDVLALAMRGGRMGAWSRNLLTGEVWWSRELEAIFGLPPGGFDGSEEGFLAYVHPEDREPVMRAVGAALETRGDYVVEFRFRDAAGGGWRWMDGRGRAVYAEGGRPTMLYGVGIDITERKRTEEELRRLNLELSEADRRKDEFLATLAHELRNPLAPIRSAAELLKRDDLAPGAASAARAIIERQARHMTRMVDDLLELGRITHGELQLRKEVVALAAVVRWAVEVAQSALDAAGVALTVELPGEPLYLEADATRLVQILANLLGNAAKFTPQGGHASLSARREGAWIEIRVRDDGIGIEARQLPRLFQMFSQVTPALERARGGLGIGLALVRGLVERHGGSVEARSEGAGRGAEFIVRLPASEAPAQPQPAGLAPPAPARSPRRVLLADDNRDAADSLAGLLRLMGHEVRVAYDGEQALRAGAEFRPDALILDIGMPRMNGYDVASRARGADWGRGAKLIALTGWGQQRDKAAAAEAGFDHHLTKPVAASALDALLS